MHAASRDPPGAAGTFSPLGGWSTSGCLTGTGPFVLGTESRDRFLASASQQGKCSHFLSEWGSEPSLCHPLLLGPLGHSAFPCLPSAVGQFAGALVLLPVFVSVFSSPFQAL